MIYAGLVSEAEMVLEFLRSDLRSPDWPPLYAGSPHLDRHGALIERADLSKEDDTRARSELLGTGRGYGLNRWLFERFPQDVRWHRVYLPLDELKRAKYLADCAKWLTISQGTRRVAEGAAHLDLHE